MYQTKLSENLLEPNNESRPKKEAKDKKEIVMVVHMLFMKVEN